MYTAAIRSICMLGLVLLGLAACGTAPASPPPATPAASSPAASASFSDPFAYCAAVGTIDAPDARYTGEPIPPALVQGMIARGLIAADAPAEFQQSAVWRCMQGQVWICHFGANLPCQEQADTSQTPSAAMEEFCAANPGADGIPAAVTGRATVYTWACQDGKPAISATVFSADPQGYLADFWYQLAAP